MRKSLLFLALLGTVVGCGAPAGPNLEQFDQPNPLLQEEISRRIEQIPYQHGQELLVTLCWLQKRGEQAIPQLVKAIGSQSPKMRSNVIWTLGRIRDTRAIPFIQGYLHDANPVVVLETAYALLTMGSNAGVKQLIEGLESEDIRYRHRCFSALRDFSGKSFDYDHNANADANQESVARWMSWWNDSQGRQIFHLQGSSSASLATPPTPGSSN